MAEGLPPFTSSRLNIDLTRWAKALCYPHLNERELKIRIEELKELEVEQLIEGGRTQLDKLKVLGKGCVGIVIMAIVKGSKMALKARRTDSSRNDLLTEANMLKLANSVGVGPKLKGATKNFLLTEFIDGEVVETWLQGDIDEHEVLRVFKELVWQCYKLDKIGLNHGELSRAGRHVIISKEGTPVIIDFESASISRRTKNVTSIFQYFLMRGPYATELRKALALDEASKERTLELLKSYKKSIDETLLKELFKELKLE